MKICRKSISRADHYTKYRQGAKYFKLWIFPVTELTWIRDGRLKS
jgi:hypothetical protein